MEDLLKVAAYIAAVVIYALLKMRKKTEKQNRPVNSEAPKKPLPHTTPPKTFAEVPPKNPATQSFEKAVKKLESEIKTSKEIIKPGNPLKQEKHLKSGRVYEEKEAYVSRYKNLESTSVSLDEQTKDHFNKYQTFSEIKNVESGYDDKSIVFEYPDEETKKNPYAEFLKDPENIKTAFVAKEIFDRKHF